MVRLLIVLSTCLVSNCRIPPNAPVTRSKRTGNQSDSTLIGRQNLYAEILSRSHPITCHMYFYEGTLYSECGYSTLPSPVRTYYAKSHVFIKVVRSSPTFKFTFTSYLKSSCAIFWLLKQENLAFVEISAFANWVETLLLLEQSFLIHVQVTRDFLDFKPRLTEYRPSSVSFHWYHDQCQYEDVQCLLIPTQFPVHIKPTHVLVERSNTGVSRI